jgi:hypothetical protein
LHYFMYMDTMIWYTSNIMKNRLVILVMLVAGIVSGETISRAKLLGRLIEMESSGRVDVVGDNGKAYGILQFHKIRVDEVNRILELRKSSIRYTHADAFSKVKSIEMFNIFYDHYDNGNRTEEYLVRLWNGNPKNTGTDAYWKKYCKKFKDL